MRICDAIRVFNVPSDAVDLEQAKNALGLINEVLLRHRGLFVVSSEGALIVAPGREAEIAAMPMGQEVLDTANSTAPAIDKTLEPLIKNGFYGEINLSDHFRVNVDQWVRERDREAIGLINCAHWALTEMAKDWNWPLTPEPYLIALRHASENALQGDEAMFAHNHPLFGPSLRPVAFRTMESISKDPRDARSRVMTDILKVVRKEQFRLQDLVRQQRLVA